MSWFKHPCFYFSLWQSVSPLEETGSVVRPKIFFTSDKGEESTIKGAI